MIDRRTMAAISPVARVVRGIAPSPVVASALLTWMPTYLAGVLIWLAQYLFDFSPGVFAPSDHSMIWQLACLSVHPSHRYGRISFPVVAHPDASPCAQGAFGCPLARRLSQRLERRSERGQHPRIPARREKREHRDAFTKRPVTGVAPLEYGSKHVAKPNPIDSPMKSPAASTAANTTRSRRNIPLCVTGPLKQRDATDTDTSQVSVRSRCNGEIRCDCVSNRRVVAPDQRTGSARRRHTRLSVPERSRG